jgi:hypothetical protein
MNKLPALEEILENSKSIIVLGIAHRAILELLNKIEVLESRIKQLEDKQ